VKILNSHRNQDVFLLVFSGIVGLFNPLVVTWDSYLYVGSGYAISHNLMESQYHWLREPLYPFILSLVSTSNNLRLLVMLQTVLIMSAIILWSKVLTHFKIMPNPKQRILTVLLSFSFVWGFGGTLLLQSLWIFLSASLAFCLTKWSIETKKYLPHISLTLILIQTLSTVFFFCSTLAVTLIIIVKKIYDGKKIAVSIAITIMVFVPSFTTLGSWEYFKNTHSLKEQIYNDSTEFWNAQRYNGWNIADKIIGIPSTFLALNSLGVEFYQGGFYEPASESRGFGMPSFENSESCGRFFPGPEVYLEKATLPRLNSCVANNVLIQISKVNKVAKYAYSIVIWIGFWCLVQLARERNRKRDYRLLSIVFFPILIQSPYLISNAGISRLGIPTTLVFIFLGVNKILMMTIRMKRQSSKSFN
jgi:hypothetical protein